ncbi:hypothetical protein Dimus_017668 [Dionaea muscipula]
MHIDAVKEFYVRLTLSHYKKKEVARSSVRGVEIEFDHLRLASILGIPRKNGIYEYIKDVRRDDEDVALVEEVNEEKEEQNQPDFDWEAMNDEVTLQGESGLDDQFFDAQVEVEEPTIEAPVVPVFPTSPGDSTNVHKEPPIAGFDPSAPLAAFLMPSSVHFKLILRELVQIEFRMTWRKLKQRMQDF